MIRFLQRHLNLLIILNLVVLAAVPLLLTFARINFAESSQVGDTIGGITAPLIGMLNAILIYLAFHEQRQAIDFQKLSIDDQRNSLRIQIDHSIISSIIGEIKNDIKELTLRVRQNGQEVTFYDIETFWKFNEVVKSGDFTAISEPQLRQFVLHYSHILERMQSGVTRIFFSRIDEIDKRYYLDLVRKFRSPLSMIPNTIRLYGEYKLFAGYKDMDNLLRTLPGLLDLLDNEIKEKIG